MLFLLFRRQIFIYFDFSSETAPKVAWRPHASACTVPWFGNRLQPGLHDNGEPQALMPYLAYPSKANLNKCAEAALCRERCAVRTANLTLLAAATDALQLN